MNIAEVLKQLDSLDYKDFEGFLLEKMKEASKEGDNSSRITLLNEMIGFCRDSCQFNKTKIYSNELLTLLDEEGLVGTQAYATSLLNIANADRASGDLDQSLEFYRKAYEIYDALLDPKDFLFASINNNMALLYQEMKDFESACGCLKKSLEIIDHYDDRIIEKAITYTNLAQSQLRLNDIDSAKESIDTAMSIFDDGRQNDYHYSGALAVYAELLFKNKEYAKAADYYEKAM
ncbi:MAG: tetratricopeptide repeat protein, partial [Lachnospiraceae bacterium]|nr:tetratricopeptide repeat protein [Lachnospiraceae bacterium]